jgi:hypothetical protein
MLKNTAQLKSKLERALVTGAPFRQVKSEGAGQCTSVIKVVAQESVGDIMCAQTDKKRRRKQTL